MGCGSTRGLQQGLVCYFCSLQGVSKSVQVPCKGIEALMVLFLIIMKSESCTGGGLNRCWFQNTVFTVTGPNPSYIVLYSP